MKKIIQIIAAIIVILLPHIQANAGYTDYAFYIGGDKADYENSYKVVSIFVPENIEWYEYKFMSGQCTYNDYGCRLAYLNGLLIQKGLDSIY